MTSRKKIVIALIILVFTVMALRETPYVDLNFYRSYTESSYNSTINTNSSFVKVGDSSTKSAPAFNSQDLSIVILLGDDTVYKQLNKLLPIVVKIENFQTGSLWIPLYKSASFSAIGTPSFDPRQKLEGKLPMGRYKIGISGDLEMNGKIVIKGFCSHKQAVELVKQQIIAQFNAKIRECFTTVPPEYFHALSSSQSL